MAKSQPKKKVEEQEPDEQEEPEQQSDDKALLRKAYGTASQQLREKRRDEFNDLYAKAAKDLGVEWSPRKTPEQRAQEQFDQLLAEYPHLAERVGETA